MLLGYWANDIGDFALGLFLAFVLPYIVWALMFVALVGIEIWPIPVISLVLAVLVSPLVLLYCYEYGPAAGLVVAAFWGLGVVLSVIGIIIGIKTNKPVNRNRET